jgi:hypothetical protein
MPTAMTANVALKEWSAVVQALATGRQIFLLRKGGIVEGKRGFELRHSEFLFFPTFEHQHARMLRTEFPELVRQPESADIALTLYGVVDAAFEAPRDRELLIAAPHIWNRTFINMRYDYRPDLPLYVVIVRAYRIEPRTIPDRPSYAGCKSWVNLTEEVLLERPAPVLSDAAFEAAQAVLFSALHRG